MKTTLSTYELTKIFISTDNEIKTDTIIAYFPKVLKNDEKLRSQYATIINYLTLSDDIYKNNVALTTVTQKLETAERTVTQDSEEIQALTARKNLLIRYDTALQDERNKYNTFEDKNILDCIATTEHDFFKGLLFATNHKTFNNDRIVVKGDFATLQKNIIKYNSIETKSTLSEDDEKEKLILWKEIQKGIKTIADGFVGNPNETPMFKKFQVKLTTTATKKLIATCCQADGITNEHLIQQSKFPMGKLRACVLAIAYDRALQHHEEITNKEDGKNE